jgi:hypothetical protein
MAMTEDQRRWPILLLAIIIGAVVAFLARWWLG